MGRQKEFKVAKSFTLGIQEIAWLAKHCHEKKIKASEFMNKLLRKAMQKDQKKEAKEANTLPYHCYNCNSHTQHTKVEMICIECDQVNQQLKKKVEEYHGYSTP